MLHTSHVTHHTRITYITHVTHTLHTLRVHAPYQPFQTHIVGRGRGEPCPPVQEPHLPGALHLLPSPGLSVFLESTTFPGRITGSTSCTCASCLARGSEFSDNFHTLVRPCDVSQRRDMGGRWQHQVSSPVAPNPEKAWPGCLASIQTLMCAVTHRCPGDSVSSL